MAAPAEVRGITELPAGFLRSRFAIRSTREVGLSVRWRCETSDWPLVVLDLPPDVDPRAVDQQSFFQQLDALLERGERFATMHDLRRAERLDAARRKRFADWMKLRDDRLRKLIIAHAPVVETSIQRGAITALLWFVTPPAETRIFTDPLEARVWLRERIAADGARR